MKAAVILNEEAGHGKKLRDKFANFNDEKFSIKLFSARGGNLDHILDEMSREDFDILIAAGGDGTVRSVAEKAVKFDKVLGVIPAGTLNHFAKDTGIPLNINEAINVIKRTATDRIDTARLTDIFF